MDPNLFYLNWDLLFEVFITLIFLSFIVERGLALLFETKFYVNRFGGKGWKELLAFVASLVVCVFAKFDLVSILFVREAMHPLGYVITAALVAGGSKASVALFKDIWNTMSDAERMRRDQLEKEGKRIPRK